MDHRCPTNETITQCQDILESCDTSVSLTPQSSNVSDECFSDEAENGFDLSPSHPKIKEYDRFADVRIRMESLALKDRVKFKLNTVSEEPKISAFSTFTSYLAYAVLLFVGHVREMYANFSRFGHHQRIFHFPSDNLTQYAPLLMSLESFYTRWVYLRLQDCFNRPVTSNPGVFIDVLERYSRNDMKTMQALPCHLGRDMENIEPKSKVNDNRMVPRSKISRRCLNLGSYNYLGFADDWNLTCEVEVLKTLNTFPISCCSSKYESGNTYLHSELENMIAKFLGKERALIYNMGFNTNSNALAALMSKDDLLISDKLNHASIVNGAKRSGTSIKVFRHNDLWHLEAIMKNAIITGKPKTGKHFRKIVVIVEGLYSMEGEFAKVKGISRICRKYGAYLYVDEAHSIGAIGKTGRGITEYSGVKSDDVDILMGTFSKSFGGMGGYIASSKKVVDFLKLTCAGSLFHNSMSPVVCKQIITSLKIIMGQDGTYIGKRRLKELQDNANYFRMRLNEMGLQAIGCYDSPVIPVMLYNIPKVASFSRECLRRGIAVVTVGFPVVPLLLARVRFCISAKHSRDDLDWALNEIDKIAGMMKLKYAFSKFG